MLKIADDTIGIINLIVVSGCINTESSRGKERLDVIKSNTSALLKEAYAKSNDSKSSIRFYNLIISTLKLMMSVETYIYPNVIGYVEFVNKLMCNRYNLCKEIEEEQMKITAKRIKKQLDEE